MCGTRDLHVSQRNGRPATVAQLCVVRESARAYAQTHSAHESRRRRALLYVEKALVGAGCFGEAREGIAGGRTVRYEGHWERRGEGGERRSRKKDDHARFRESRLACAICLAIAINSSRARLNGRLCYKCKPYLQVGPHCCLGLERSWRDRGEIGDRAQEGRFKPVVRRSGPTRLHVLAAQIVVTAERDRDNS